MRQWKIPLSFLVGLIAVLFFFQNCSPMGPKAATSTNLAASVQNNFNLDIDNDAKVDSAFSLVQNGSSLTLQFQSAVLPSFSLNLRVGCRTTSCGRLIHTRLIRSLAPASQAMTAILYSDEAGSHVGVVNLVTQEASADFSLPGIDFNQMTVLYPKDPAGVIRPVITSAYAQFASYPNDLNVWGTYVCVYAPGYSDPGCGTGFGKWDIRPRTLATGYEKHLGGLVMDADGDGYEDLFLPFFSEMMIVSMRTGQVLNELVYDVAQSNNGYSNAPYSALPAFFHSGRNYGTHSIRANGGKIDDLIIGGNPVGTFGTKSAHGDYSDGGDGYVTMCDVSRFVAVLRSEVGEPSSQRLLWSRYTSFYQPVFSPSSDSSLSAAPTPLKEADMVNHCIHYFSNGRIQASDGGQLVGMNQFESSQLVNGCDQELWTYSRTEGFQGGTAANRFYECLTQNIETPGRWTIRGLWLDNGSDLLTMDSAYAWGIVSDLVIKGQSYLIVEPLGSSVGFNVATAQPRKLRVYQINSQGGWHWVFIGEFPVAERPALTTVGQLDDSGHDTTTAFSFNLLVTADRDGDGHPEIQLSSGGWVGWSKSTQSFVLKFQ